MDSAFWNAIVTNDQCYDGKFFYGVKSTGIFCRPSCPSKPPRPDHVIIFNTRQEALEAGFRPCKRCRPDLETYHPADTLADQAKEMIDQYFANPALLKEKLDALGVTRRHLGLLFGKKYCLSLEQYIAQKRFQKAKELLDAGWKVTDTAFEIGLQSSASFTAFFKKQAGMTPKDYLLHQADDHPYCFCQTPIGVLRIEENQFGITSVQFVDDQTEYPEPSQDGIFLKAAKKQIDEYFAQKRTTFELPLSLTGSDFQKQVWKALSQIPYGQTRSYQQIAEQIGNKDAARAVGMANNRNPVLLLIPCHRVVGKDGKLVGYAGGLERKQYLLEMEATQ